MGERKVRSDKKRSVAPTIEVDLYETIAQLAYICSIPIKAAGELITVHTLNSRHQIETMSSRFRRNFTFGDSIYLGDINRPQYRFDYDTVDTKRLSMRHLQNVHDRLAALAYALDSTVSAANASVLRHGAYSRPIILDIIIHHSETKLNGSRRNQLHTLLKRMNEVNDNESERISLTMLVNLVVDECIEKNITLEQVICEYIG